MPRKETMADRPCCLHCKRNLAIPGKRGLCVGCYMDLSIREQYPRYCQWTPASEPTEAELDAMIAERMARLPRWWNNERCKALGDGRGDTRVSATLQRIVRTKARLRCRGGRPF